MNLAIIVPGRLESTRFPKKLLYEIDGQPLIVHTAKRIQDQVPDLPLYFAVDHEDLARALNKAGFETIMTRDDHPSGTDRLAEANEQLGADHVINVQADEPLVTRSQIEMLGHLIQKPGIDLATMAHEFHRVEDFQNPNQVKVVLSKQGEALYFSRSPIPYPRDFRGAIDEMWLKQNSTFRHLGLYAYTNDFLKAYTKLEPTFLEKTEKLEQLRALENGYRIAVGITQESSIGVDTPEDAEKFERYLISEP